MTGETLRKERERQKLTIQDIEQGTSIRSAYIEALENGDYDKLPGEVYAKGFVKNYANFLNLDAEKLAKDFSAEISQTVSDEVSEISDVEEKITAENKKADKLKITEIQSPNVKVRDSESSSSSNLTIIAAVFLIAIFAGGAWYYLQNASDNVANVTNVNPPAQTEVTQPAENNQPAPVANPVSAAVPQDGVNIQAKFNGECWTRVFVDGVFAYEGVPAAGEIMNWHAVEGVTIRVGNAAGIEVSMNGQNYGVLGGIGEVIERTFTRQ